MPYLREHPELHAAFRRGDNVVLTRLYRIYMPDVAADMDHGYIIQSTGARIRFRSATEHADGVQEVFFRAFQPKALAAYKLEHDYKKYLNTIGRNVCVDYHRRTGRERLASKRGGSDDPYVVGDLIEAPSEGPPSHGWLEPRAREIARAYIANLHEPLRGVYEARYLQLMSQHDAAVERGMVRDQLRKLEDRLKRELRALLEEAGIRDSNIDAPEAASHG